MSRRPSFRSSPQENGSAARKAATGLFSVAGGALFALGGPALLSNSVRQVGGPTTIQYVGNLFSVFALGLAGLIVGGLIGGWFVRAVERIGIRWEELEAGDKVTLFVGTFAGLVMSIPIIQFFAALDGGPAAAQTKLVIIPAVVIGLSALAIYALQSMADILPWNRGRMPKRRSGMKILDTNVIIDGRIYEVAKAGFLDGNFYVPRFVLEELQHIADSSDAMRRGRGRRGLDILGHMQAEFDVEVGTHDEHAPDRSEEVDSRIVRLAKALGADVVTNDWNLNRVANLQDVKVMSLNDLALALRTNVLPEEKLTVKLIREGNQPGQGVGYLEDGTMVVVEGGADGIGGPVEAIVSQVIQTERGKMIFAEVEGFDTRPEAKRRPPRRSVG